jgi:hypothetical protein
MLHGVKSKQPLTHAVDGRISHDHLRIKQRMARQLTVEEPAVAVSPVHHRRNGKWVAIVGHVDPVRSEVSII